jgi:hypothetical protein
LEVAAGAALAAMLSATFLPSSSVYFTFTFAPDLISVLFFFRAAFERKSVCNYLKWRMAA